MVRRVHVLVMLALAASVAIRAFASDPKPAAVMMIPQVWVDASASTFHSLGCRRINKGMTRVARSVAKMQRLTPANECAITDAEAKRVWALEFAKGNPATTRGGGVTYRSGAAVVPIAVPKDSATRTAPERPRENKPAPVTWNDVMAASDFSNAEQVIRAKCSREWPADARMFNFCADRETEALGVLKRLAPATADQEKWNRKRVECAAEWPGDYRMRLHCESR